jgi:hypothetical protein
MVLSHLLITIFVVTAVGSYFNSDQHAGVNIEGKPTSLVFARNGE